MYIALIGDIINSKQLAQRSAVQEHLKNLLNSLNQQYEHYIVSPFTLTIGDEFQAVLKPDAPFLFMLELLNEQLKPVILRFGIGIGEIVTEIDQTKSIGADGPAYWNARAAIEYIHEKNDYGMNELAIRTGDRSFDQTVNTLIATTAYMKSTWTDSQKQFFAALLERNIYTEKFEQKAIAESLRLSESAFTKRLKNGGLKIYFRARDLTQQQIQQYAQRESGGEPCC